MNLFLNQQDKSVKKVGRSLLTIEYEFNLEERSVKFMETFEYNEERFRMHLELQKELTFYIHSEQTKQIFLDLGFIEADKLLPIPR